MAEDDFKRRITGGLYRSSRYPASVGGFVDPTTGNLASAPPGAPTPGTPLPQPVAEARNRLFDVSTNPRAQFGEGAGVSDGPADTGIAPPGSAFAEYGPITLGALGQLAPGLGLVGMAGRAVNFAADQLAQAEGRENSLAVADAVGMGPNSNPGLGGLADLGFAVPGDGFGGGGVSEAGPSGGYGEGFGADPGIGSAVGEGGPGEGDAGPGGGNDSGGVGAYRHGGLVRGPGDGDDDAVPARLSNGEFVMPTKTVTAIGGGDHRRGAERLASVVSATDALSRAVEMTRPLPAGISRLARFGGTR